MSNGPIDFDVEIENSVAINHHSNVVFKQPPGRNEVALLRGGDVRDELIFRPTRLNCMV